jgi:hypothetical protein
VKLTRRQYEVLAAAADGGVWRAVAGGHDYGMGHGRVDRTLGSLLRRGLLEQATTRPGGEASPVRVSWWWRPTDEGFAALDAQGRRTWPEGDTYGYVIDEDGGGKP